MIPIARATYSSRDVCQFWRKRLKSLRAIVLLTLKDNEKESRVNRSNFGGTLNGVRMN